eukprot:gene171-11038_t
MYPGWERATIVTEAGTAAIPADPFHTWLITPAFSGGPPEAERAVCRICSDMSTP